VDLATPFVNKRMISLVIGCLNEGDQLKATLEGALAIQPPHGGLEISIVDDGSIDSSTAFLDTEPWLQFRRDGWLRLRRHPRPEGISRGRFFGALGCRGDVLIFMDAHLSFPQDDLWLQIEQHFSEDRSDLLGVDCRDRTTGASCVGSVYTSKRLCHQATGWMRVQRDPLINELVPFINGGFFAIKRSVYQRIGGFPLFLQGWGHEDRYLSMLAAYFGYRSMVNQGLVVDHLYKSAFVDSRPDFHGISPSFAEDGLPSDGIQGSIQPAYSFAQDPGDRSRQLLMNSLRCGAVLYSDLVKESLYEQLRADYGHDAVARALSVIEIENDQLMAYRQALGLDDSARDSAMEAFFGRWQSYLPMLVEAELQLIRALPPAEALLRIQQLPVQLVVLHDQESEQYSIARHYLEASFAYDLADWLHVIKCLSELLSLDPDYMPALRMYTIALRSMGRHKAYRHWLEHASAVIARHESVYGPGPIGPWHPASSNAYLRHLYWIEVDRSIWMDLVDLYAKDRNVPEAARFLCKLLAQTPDDPSLLTRLAEISRPESSSLAADSLSPV
jgi:tetratricopeptide (TPR) repeat protein